jgi:beta-xylosidase
MGLLREDGTPKLALEPFAEYTPDLGICQWFNFEDHRLDEAVRWLRRLGVKYLRTGLSWADSLRPNALDWFDRQMRALEEFEVTLTFCFTPESCGVMPHYTSPPKRLEEFADFCVRMVRRYVGPPAARPQAGDAEAVAARRGAQGAAPVAANHSATAAATPAPPSHGT